MKAVFLDYATMGPGLDARPLSRLFSEFESHDVTARDEVAERIRDAEFVFANKALLKKDNLDAATRLRMIGLTATGTDNVDLEVARQHGIAVCNIRAYCTRSVVEHVFGVMLMLTHSLGRYDATVRAGEWQRAHDFCLLSHPIRELSAMTLGIVGHGELGRGVAAVAQAFGMRVLVAARPGAAQAGGSRVPFDDLLADSDVISLHCPLTDATRNLIDGKAIARMKPGAFLINTARGGLVDSGALAAALENGHLGGAAVDVLSKEPPVDGDPLLDHRGGNLIITPHIAWAGNEARQNAIAELAANVEAFLAGRERNRVV
jgi:glycerate dehydrogenase